MDAGFNGWLSAPELCQTLLIVAMKRNKITIAAQENVNLVFYICVFNKQKGLRVQHAGLSYLEH